MCESESESKRKCVRVSKSMLVCYQREYVRMCVSERVIECVTVRERESLW